MRPPCISPGRSGTASLPSTRWTSRTQEIVTAGTGNHFRVTPLYESGGAGLTASLKAYSTVLDAVSCGGVGANGVRILSPESIATWSPQLAQRSRAGRLPPCWPV